MALSDMTPAEILKEWPTKPPKPIKKYTNDELYALRKFGPATIGGELYLAAQKALAESKEGVLGEAILSKSTEPVVYRSLR